MRIRLHFTSDDLSRLRVAKGPDPLWEIVLSAHVLANTSGRALFGCWLGRSRSRLSQLPRSQVRLIRHLNPPTGDFPDFLTPPQAAPELEAGMEQVLSTPVRRLRRDLTVLPGRPGWTRALADGDPTVLTALRDAFHGYYRAALAPVWPRVRALVEADRAVRSRALLDDGVDGLLHGLRPMLRWSPPVLEADYPVDRDLHLAGRGLLLVPSVFCWRMPVSYVDDDLPPVLVYPVAREPGWCSGTPGRDRSGALADLLGRSRSAALRAVEEGCTTGELARRIGLTPPTVSRHTAALREADLIVSVRHRNEVVHTLTPLGAALLRANR